MKLDDLTDEDIERFASMPKRVLNPGARDVPKLKHLEKNFDLESLDGEHFFSIYVRQSTKVPESFSCGLSVILPSKERVTLRRYNGFDHTHPNKLEGTVVGGCHVHHATERYIKGGRKAEGYAMPTNSYNDVAGALRCLVRECAVEGLERQRDDDSQRGLFGDAGI